MAINAQVVFFLLSYVLTNIITSFFKHRCARIVEILINTHVVVSFCYLLSSLIWLGKQPRPLQDCISSIKCEALGRVVSSVPDFISGCVLTAIFMTLSTYGNQGTYDLEYILKYSWPEVLVREPNIAILGLHHPVKFLDTKGPLHVLYPGLGTPIPQILFILRTQPNVIFSRNPSLILFVPRRLASWLHPMY